MRIMGNSRHNHAVQGCERRIITTIATHMIVLQEEEDTVRDLLDMSNVSQN